MDYPIQLGSFRDEVWALRIAATVISTLVDVRFIVDQSTIALRCQRSAREAVTQRVPAQRKFGRQLGLDLTRRLAEARGGSVGMRSELEAESTFYLVLNRHHGTDEPRGATALPPTA